MNKHLITFSNSKSLNITYKNTTLDFAETEELSYLFINQLIQHSNIEPAFTIGFPFDMISFFFHYKDDNTITIGWVSFDDDHRNEIQIDSRLFFQSLIESLEGYFNTIELKTPLPNYIIDNNPHRNKGKRWSWDMIDTLRGNYLN